MGLNFLSKIDEGLNLLSQREGEDIGSLLSFPSLRGRI